MRFRIAASMVLVLAASVEAIAHETFFADIKFDSWERHCHTFTHQFLELGEEQQLQMEECWAVYQSQLHNEANNEVGFVIIVDESSSQFPVEIRNINLFRAELNFQIGDNRPFRFACHADICTPWTREDGSTIFEQLATGRSLMLWEEEQEKLEVPLVEFSSAMTP